MPVSASMTQCNSFKVRSKLFVQAWPLPWPDIEITAREIMKLKKELYTIISEHSHTDFDKVWADSDRDYWMTAEEAKEYGMIDKVLARKA